MIKISSQYTTLWRLALPVIIAQVGQMSVQLVDTLMVGQLGAVPLAGVSFANSLMLPISIAGMGLAMGLTPLVGRATARGDFSRVQSLLKNSIVLNAAIGVFLTGLLFLATFLLDKMGQDAEILPIARSYSFLMVASILPMMFFATARQFLEGLSNTKWTMVITITGNLVNVGLNFVLIYGYLGMPEMGAVGAGVSTLISRVLMVGMFVVLFYRRQCYRRFFCGLSRVRISGFRIRRLFNVGGPIAVQIGVEMVAMSLMTIAVGTFGADYLAAHQIAINIPSLSFMVVMGIANATTIIVSRNYGLRLYGEIRRTLRSAIITITCFMILSATLFLSFAYPIVSIFTSEEGVAVIAAQFLIFGAVFQLSDGIQGVMLGALRGLLQVMRPMYFAIGTYLLVGLPVGYICSVTLDLGPYGVWVGFIASLTVLAGLYFIEFRSKIRRLIQHTTNATS
ncbi:MAG: MATE family efflux transporter [Mucinivorans sp.]